MKRLILATLMVLMVAGILGMVSAQDTCPARPDGATRTDLLAGQTTNIGNVWVWNDDEFVYVQYDITVSGWYLTETHADVRCDWTLIPQNTNHNPEPGHFAKKESFAVTSHTTTWCTKIPMPTCAAECNHELAVAAHAAVVQLKETCSDVVSGTAVTTVTQRRSGDALVFSPVNLPAIDAWEPGSRYPNDGLDDSAWQANSLWDQQIYGKGIDTNIADWIWETYLVQDPVLGTALTMTTPLFNGYPVSGDLYITCDNGYQAFVNGQSVGSANVAPGFQTSDLKHASVDTNGWQSVQHYDLAPFLVSGPNTLTIDAANEYLNPDDPPNTLTGTVSNNPGACIFQAPVCYETIKRTETAWGAGTRFTFRGNWATWITYYPGCIVRYPPSGNVYIGYEDWGQGDYDYNDFGMKASFEEEYIGGLTNAYLQKITMHFVPVIYDSGMNHLIHIKRTDLVGSFDGEVTHPGYVPDILTLHDGSTGAETAPGTSIGLTGDLDVVLFNTAKYSWPEKIPAFGTEEVTVVVTMTSPTS
ncbi:MAG: hypothetical protein LUQ41_01820, partial [Methanomicrobiales archaeon]|nr:hypothetical protein [Methanomicrobiales archaeon]